MLYWLLRSSVPTLRARLLAIPRVVVAAVPWHLESALGTVESEALTREIPRVDLAEAEPDA